MAALAIAFLALHAAAAGGAPDKVLVASVGLHDAYKISLRTSSGQLVRTLPAGTYSIVVHDYSHIHNFALGSQTENKRIFTTGIPFVGTKHYVVHLTAGRYTYACSAHFQTMFGRFVVTAA